MDLRIRIKTNKLQPSSLQPIVGPIGLVSKEIVKEIEKRLEHVNRAEYKKYLFTLSIDVANRSYILHSIDQPDSLVLISYSKSNQLTKEKVFAYAECSLMKSYAKSITSRVKELESVMKSCKLKYVA